MPEQIALLLRATALIVWAVVLVRIFRHASAARVRRLIDVGCLVAVLSVIVVGGLVPSGLVSGSFARVLYTAAATVVLIGGIGVLTSGVEE